MKPRLRKKRASSTPLTMLRSCRKRIPTLGAKPSAFVVFVHIEICVVQIFFYSWFIIHGKVYDVTEFLDDHPGGPEIMKEHAGTDATEEFEEVFHSDQARDQLKDYLKGDLKGYTGPAMPRSGGAGGGAGGGSSSFVYLVIHVSVGLVVAACAFRALYLLPFFFFRLFCCWGEC